MGITRTADAPASRPSTVTAPAGGRRLTPSWLRRAVGSTFMIGAIVGGSLLSAPSAFALASTFTYTPDPVNGAGAVIVERVAPVTDGSSATWRMNLDLLAKNNSGAGHTLTRVVIAYPGSAIATRDVTGLSQAISAYQQAWVIVPENRTLPFPLPSTVQVTLYWNGYDAQTVSYPLALYRDNTLTGGYRFPSIQKAAGMYWSIRNTQDIGAGHRGFRPQKFAYDLGVSRWDATAHAWVETRAAASDPNPGTLTNDDYLSFGMPLYAMHAGTIIECRSDKPDNTPQNAPGTAGGNSLWIDFGNGEIGLYAHLEAGTMPAALCPVQSKTANENGGVVKHATHVAVSEGQFLGRAGNSGATGGHPHFHLHLQDRAPADWIDGNDSVGAQGLPLLFDHALMRTAGANMAGFDPTISGQPGWSKVTASAPSAMPSFSLNNPNSCGWKPVPTGLAQWERHAISATCFQEVFSDATIKGYRPIFLDAYDVNGASYTNMVFRPTAGVAWKAYAGMTDAGYQSTFTTVTGLGYRLLQVDSYLSGGTAHYDAIFVKQAGPAYVAYHGVDAAIESFNVTSLTSQGYHPVSMSVISVGGVRQWTALWVQSNVGTVHWSSGIAEANYASYIGTQVSAGLKQVYVNAYLYNGGVYFAAIFVQNVPANWVTEFGISSSQLGTDTATQVAAGRLTVAETGYSKGGVATFAAVWLGN